MGTLVGHLLLRVWGSNRPRLLLVGRHGATHHLLLLRMRWLLIRMWGKSTVLQRSLIRSMHCLRGLLFRLRGWSGLRGIGPGRRRWSADTSCCILGNRCNTRWTSGLRTNIFAVVIRVRIISHVQEAHSQSPDLEVPVGSSRPSAR